MSDNKDNGRYRKFFDSHGLPPDAGPAETGEAHPHLEEKHSAEPSDENDIDQNGNRPPVIGKTGPAHHFVAEEDDCVCPKVTEIPKKNGRTEKSVAGETDEKHMVFTGQILREIREKMTIEFDDITRETKISQRMLNAIENENFDTLPPEVYVRGFIKGYATALSLNVNKVVKDYMSRYGSWKKGSDKHRTHFRFSRKKDAFSIQAKK